METDEIQRYVGKPCICIMKEGTYFNRKEWKEILCIIGELKGKIELVTENGTPYRTCKEHFYYDNYTMLVDDIEKVIELKPVKKII